VSPEKLTASGRMDHSGLALRRLVVAGLSGVLVLGVALAVGASWSVAVTCGWVGAAIVFLAWVWWAIAPKDATQTERHAQAEDFSRATSDLVLLSAASASLLAVAFDLADAGRHSGADKGLLIALAIVSVALAWASVHTIFLLRYARLYYDPPPGGIDFNEDEPPEYRDFAYVAFTIGMTWQVSDTELTVRPIRRTAIRHALLSFVFGSVIVAITINVVASLLNG
jgi:uncharacterized membrane protein